MSFASLHGHDETSNLRLLDCVSKPEAIIDQAQQLQLDAIAITNHDCLSSFVKFEKYLSQKKKDNPDDAAWQKLKFIRGNEIYLVRNGLTKDNFQKGEDSYYHFILLAKDYIGYQQLCELSTRAWKRSYKHYHLRVPTYYNDLIDVISSNPGHLIGSTACLGSQLGSQLLKAKEKKITKTASHEYCIAWINRMKDIMGEGNLYLETQPGVSPDQVYVNRELLVLSRETNTPLIVTTDHHYTKKEDRKIHKAYLQSKNGDREVDSFYEATYMMSEEEMVERLKVSYKDEAVALAQEMFANTIKIANMCEEYSLLKPLEIPYIPTTFDKPEVTINDPLVREVRDAIPNLDIFLNSEYCNRQFATRIIHFLTGRDTKSDPPRYLIKKKCDQMNTELGIIWESGQKIGVHWSKYLLQVSDYLEIFWTEGDTILAPSRGSAGASYSCHALGINQIDPTREKAPLIFERFMNPERVSVLDIDSDVESTKRNKCIDALIKHYGIEHVTRVGTFKTEKARSAILTAARALGIDIDKARGVASYCKAPRGMPYTLTQMYYGDIEEDLAPNKEFIREISQVDGWWEIASGIEGLINGLSSHAGGVIITEEPISHTCGIMKTSGGDLVTCFDLHECEDLSLIKVDLLATEGLSKIRTCLDLLVDYGYVTPEKTLKETYEKVIGVYNLERDDPEMWKLVWENKIPALFQMEQQSGIQGIALTKPSNIEDLATLNSVIRLMPPDKDSERPLEKFARFREDPFAWEREMDEYGLSKEEKKLMHRMFDYSSGIAAQQEDLYQLMRAEEIVGYGFGRADVLRKAVAKKNPKDYKAFEDQFWEDVKARGSSIQLCKYIWNVLVAAQRG